MSYILLDESGNALSDESSNSLFDDYVPVSLNAGSFSLSGLDLTAQAALGVSLDAGSFSLSGLDATAFSTIPVALDAGSYTQTGLDLSFGFDLVSGLNAGSYTLSGLDLTASVPSAATNILQNELGSTLTDESGLALYDEQTLGSAVTAALGTFTLSGYDFSTILSGPIEVTADAGAFNISGPLLSIGSGLGALDGTLNTAPDPDEISYTADVPFDGTVYWVVTASATPPALQATPPGFASSGLANGSFAVTTSGGTDTIDLSAVGGGNYYIHTVGYRTTDGAFTSVDSDAIVIDGDLGLGTFAIVGYSIDVSRLIRADLGAFALTGYDANINDTNVSLDAGTLTLTGLSLGVTPSIPLGVGSYSLSGYAANVSKLVPLQSGTFNVSGLDTAVSGSVADTLAGGSFTITGQDMVVAANFNSALGVGSYTLTGRALTLIDGSPVELAAGGFVISGFGVTATILEVADPNIALPQNSLRGGVLVASKRDGIVTSSSRGGVLPQSARRGIVKRGS